MMISDSGLVFWATQWAWKWPSSRQRDFDAYMELG